MILIDLNCVNDFLDYITTSYTDYLKDNWITSWLESSGLSMWIDKENSIKYWLGTSYREGML